MISLPDGMELKVNDDWEDGEGELVRSIWGDFINLADGSASSALVTTLDPGRYTAKVEGKDGSSGVALVEVYTVDHPGREALTALYDALDGANWTRSDNWGTDAPLDQWHGVRVDDRGRVIRLNLSKNGLSGDIPAEIGDLESLQNLWLFGNELSGPIPAELGNLTNLEELLLFDNQLSGPLPAEIGDLENLQTMWLYNNQLSGSIPAEIGDLENLQSLDLTNNQLIGEIPGEIGNLAGLKDLWLSRNWLNGSIPAELGDLANLEALLLDGNQLSGEIPEELGNLANLQDLWVSGNQLSGAIPVEIGVWPICKPCAGWKRIDRGVADRVGEPGQFARLVGLGESVERGDSAESGGNAAGCLLVRGDGFVRAGGRSAAGVAGWDRDP